MSNFKFTLQIDSSNLIWVTTLLFIIAVNSLMAQNLKQHQWKYRVVILQTLDSTNNSFQKQLKEFKKSNDAFSNRKIVLYEVVNSKYRVTNYVKNSKTEWMDIDPEFTYKFPKNKCLKVTLIGLDGGIKLNRDELILKQELFNSIDAMPMRVRELQKSKQ